MDETSECRPVSQRSRQRVEAEDAWRKFADETGVPVAIIRLAGIYGPGAGRSRRSGAARRAGSSSPGRSSTASMSTTSRQIVEAAFERRADGIFNGSDDEPAPPQDVLAYAAELLGLPPPPEVAFDEAELTPMARSFYGESKRVRNDKIKRELGVRARLSDLSRGADGDRSPPNETPRTRDHASLSASAAKSPSQRCSAGSSAPLLAMSPSATMPQSRFSRVSTGSRRT